MVSVKALYGTNWCSDCIRLKEFLDEYDIPYLWIDLDKDEEAAKIVEKLNNGKRLIPTIVFSDGTFMVEPSKSVLGVKLGIDFD